MHDFEMRFPKKLAQLKFGRCNNMLVTQLSNFTQICSDKASIVIVDYFAISSALFLQCHQFAVPADTTKSCCPNRSYVHNEMSTLILKLKKQEN
jgi:hypothetical protein